MPKKRQLVLIRQDAKGAAAPLGPRKDVRAALAPFNTAPDGGQKPGGPIEVLYGPGFTVEVATSQEPVSQALVTVIEEDIAWPVLSRACKTLGWKMQDVETGRVFG